MMIKAMTITGAVLLAAALSVYGQGTFQNLDFESANLSAIPAGQYGGEVSLSAALPDWSASIAGVAVTQVLQNNLTITAASVDILGPDWTSTFSGVIDGNYTAVLESVAISGTTDDASIFQSGTIPIGTQSLELKAWSFQPTAQFTVSFNGNTLSAVPLSSGQSASGQPYTVYGFNVIPYAGDPGQLEITTIVPNGNGLSQIEFDDISFSPGAVPEPTALALSGIGGVLIALYRRFAPKRQ
jgi:hypothetical protein